MMTINHDQAKALARYVHTIRDDWHIDGILTAVGKARDQASIETLTMWAIRAALDANNRTPAVIAMPGPHREPTKPEVRRSFNVACPDHPDQIQPCRRCTAARVPAEQLNAAALARAALAQSLAQLCPHGVKRGQVKCGECERPDRDVPAAELDDHPATPPDHDTAPSAEEETA